MTLWACLVLLLLASPDAVDAAKTRRKKTNGKSTADAKGHANLGGGDRGGGAGGGGGGETSLDASESSEPSRVEPIPETRDDALVFHSESAPEPRWSWRNAQRRVTRTWEEMSSRAGTLGEKLHLPSEREREMVWYYARLIGSRVKQQWNSVDWDQVAEEVPEIKGFRKTWSEFRNATGFSAGSQSQSQWSVRGVLTWPLAFCLGVGKWALGLCWTVLSSPLSAGARVFRWLTAAWWSTALSVLVGWVLYQGTEVKIKVTPSGMPALPGGAQEMRALPKVGHYTLDSFPKNMRGRLIHPKGVWARVDVSKGKLRYKALADPGEGNQGEKELSYMRGGAVVPPLFPFEIAPVAGEKVLKFRIVYYNVPPPGVTDATDANDVTAAPAAAASFPSTGAAAGQERGRKFSFKFGGTKT